VWMRGRSLEQSIGRVDPFASVPPQSRPSQSATAGTNYLVLGVDAPPGSDTAGFRADTIILVHVSEDRRRADMISIPRDTWVTMPASARARHGAKAKINAAFAWGGAPLLVQTVETFTGVRIDHVAMVDFAGFERVIDVLGGVTVSVDENFTTPTRRFTKGIRHMDGETALDYARQRPFADGDFTRIRHQQQVFRAVLDRATERGLLVNPGKLNTVLDAVADAVTVDRDLSLFDTVWALRNLRADDISALTSPTARTAMIGDQSVVLADEKAAAELFAAVRTDTVDAWLEANPRTGG
jgi:LCP family protein required for cell wall assembly